MLKLINFSDYSPIMDYSKESSERLSTFLQKHKLDGVEFIQHNQFMPWNPNIIPPDRIKGLHMQFWPIWLDFWKGDMEEVLRQFGNKEVYTTYYDGETRKTLVEYYRKELDVAHRMGVHYVVFHVSHVQEEHSYNYQFTYEDEEIIDAFIEMLNEVLEGVEIKFDLLLENQWWPGLTMLDSKGMNRLLERIRYPRTGFMLDIGHMMNTNRELKSEEEAVIYIMEVLQRLGDVSAYIKGIHLNSSLSGKYVKKVIQEGKPLESGEFFERYHKTCLHIAEIDRHGPFMHPSIQKVLQYLNPEYVVFELRADSLKELEGFIELQNSVLGK